LNSLKKNFGIYDLVSPFSLVRDLEIGYNKPNYGKLSYAVGKVIEDKQYLRKLLGSYTGDAYIRSAGKGFGWKEAVGSFIGEVIERISLALIDKERLNFYTINDLSHKGVEFVSPLDLLKYGRALRTDRFTDESRIVRETKFAFVEGMKLWSKKKVLLPAGDIYLGDIYRFERQRELVYLSTSNGAAVHESDERAVASGLSELLERNDFMTVWMCREPKYTLKGILEIKLLAGSAFIGHINTLTNDPNDYTTHIACFRAPQEPLFIMAGAAHVYKHHSLMRALAEIFQGEYFVNTLFEKYKQEGKISSILKAVLEEKKIIADFDSNAVFYSTAKGYSTIAGILNQIFDGFKARETIEFSDLGGFLMDLRAICNDTDNDESARLRSLFERSNLNAMVVDLTPTIFGDLGLSVRKTVCMELVPFTPPSILPTAHPRVSSCTRLNTMMHPYP